MLRTSSETEINKRTKNKKKILGNTKTNAESLNDAEIPLEKKQHECTNSTYSKINERRIKKREQIKKQFALDYTIHFQKKTIKCFCRIKRPITKHSNKR